MTDLTIFRAESDDGEVITVVGYEGEDEVKFGHVVRTIPGVADIWSNAEKGRVEPVGEGRYQVVATGKTYRAIGP